MIKQHTHPAAGHTDGHVIRWARLYDSLVGFIALGRERRLREQTILLAELRAGQRVLDVGCGTGTLLIAAAAAEPAVALRGIDPASEMIERARHKAAAAGVKAELEVGVVEKLDIATGSIDVVLSSLMLHHLPPATLRTGLAEIHRVLTPGGRFVAVDFPGPGPLMHRLGSLFARGRTHEKRHRERVLDELKGLGFAQVTQGKMKPGFLVSIVAKKAG